MKTGKMRSTTLPNKYATGIATFGSLIAVPVLIIRMVVNLPAMLVDAIERFAYEK